MKGNVKFLVKLGKSGNEIREMLVQVYGDNATKKTAVYKWVKRFSGEEKCHWWREIRMASNKQNWRKYCKSLSNCAWKSSADCQEHSRASERWQRNRKILTADLDMRKVCAKMVPKELTEEQKQRSHNLPRPFGEARWHFGPCHHRWWNMGLPIQA